MFSVIVPVLHNFEGCCRLLSSINEPFVPVVIDNWVENRGVAAGWNLGIHKSLEMGIEEFVIMNDDAYFKSGSPSDLINALDKNTAFSIPSDEIGFACFAINMHTISKVGFFDENYILGYHEDNDYAYRCRLEGMEYKVTNTDVVHDGSRTQFWNGTGDNERVVSHERFRLNREYYIKKWGGEPGKETHRSPFADRFPVPIYHSNTYRRTS